jgi:hypothetical protein
MNSYATPSSFSASNNAACLVSTLHQSGQSHSPECDSYDVIATNSGSLATDGSNIVLTDTLPAQVVVHDVSLFASPALNEEEENPSPIQLGRYLCTTVSTTVKCEYPGVFLNEHILPEALGPDQTLTMEIGVTVTEPSAAESLVNTATITGGGAPDQSTTVENTVGGAPPPFGPADFEFYISGLDGTRDTQAGDHPYELTTTIDLNNEFRQAPDAGYTATGIQDPKDIVADLPLGFVGSILSAPECTFSQLSSEYEVEVEVEGHRRTKAIGGCPPDTIVGHLLTEPVESDSINSPIYNMVPERGVPAEFAYHDALKGPHVFYVHVVPTPQGYVLQTINPDIPQITLDHIVVTFYGDPALRDGSGNSQIPYFTNPTGCANGPLVTSIYMDSWAHPGALKADGTPELNDPAWVSGPHGQSISPAVTGCNALQFTPELGAQPTTHEADTPSGMEFEIKQPQPEETGTLATSTLKNAVVKLPEGFTVDPSAGDGLAACSEAQIGWVGPSTMNFNPAEPECPEASKIGSLELSTPLIPNTLTGVLYLARQEENPFKTLLAAYVVVKDPVTGVLIKIAGQFLPNTATGQMTAVFDENPQLPFSDLKLHFFGGPRAELATPENCGTYTTNTELTPWSAPDSGLPSTPFDSFPIDEGCVSGFNPTFTAGATNLQAGAYTPFVASFSRSDTDQEITGLSITLPPGLLADVGSVPLCGEAQANAGTCPESSQVGTVQTGVGPGPNPLFVGGKAYLTGPYNGGPYGLSVVVPAVAGPFNFGTVVVRQSIRINPTTAQVTDVSDPFPTIIDGIPLRLRRVDVTLNRPGFTFNPTNCSKLGFSGGLQGSAPGTATVLNGTIGYATANDASAAPTAPFQVTNCASLKFQPKFSVSTSGKTSRADGASLTAKLSYPNVPQGTEANITRVKVDLPKQLPSRLTTLQKACTVAQFNLNPANCPKESKIGFATVHTPILPQPLSGPAIFVSHGGEAFPSLTMVLQGDGVTIDLVGTTFISKAGITSTTFKTVPDTPFSTFELKLPQGKYSALAANGNLCTSKLAMPTEFLAQNGAKINESTAISVSGCSTGIAIVSHKIKGRTLTVSVSVPAAGILTASGKGLSRSSKSAKGRETVTFKLTQKKPGKLSTKLKIAFKPSKGGKQAKSLSVKFKK